MSTTNIINKILASTILTISLSTPVFANSNMQNLTNTSYQKPSEKIAYPNLKDVKSLNILVKISQNRVYIRSGKNIIYTMYCSAGKIDPKTKQSYTPTGHFQIQQERGNSFYNQKLAEGAQNYISFKDHGTYLFHSVPTNSHNQFKKVEAQKLGHRPASHGCIRLSIPDSNWFAHNIPTGTPVTIKK